MQLSRLTTPNSSKSFIRLLIFGSLMVCSGMLNTLSSSPSLDVPPNLNLDLQPNSFSNCGGFTASVVVIGSQVGYSYQLLNAGVPTGSPLNGTGGNIIITSGPINVSTTLTVRATEIIAPFDTGILTEAIPVTISQLPTTSNAGNNQVNCGLSIALNGNAPTVGTGTWTLVNGPGTANFNNPNQRNTLVTVSQQGTYTFQWSISNGVCPPSTDDVIITFFAPPTPADAGPNQLVCGLSATMQAIAPTNGNGSWFLVSGPGGASFENSTDPNTNINVFTSGSYIFQWIVFNGVCPFSSDQVTIAFTEDQVTADAGSDQVVCALSTNLAANSPGAFSGSWTVISGPGVATLAAPSSPTSNFSADIAGVYILEWSIDNAPCPISSDQVAIEFTLTTEVCDGIDNDCDTQIDEGFDVDGDGFTSCGGDCDDNNNAIFPGAPELCDGLDNDCDTDIDEGVTTTFYADADGDTFGDPLNTIQACTLPIGFVANNADCDDSNAAINPSASELCDGVDNNCNTQIDEGVTTTYYADVDGDTFGDPLTTVQACSQPVGFVLDNTDCDDSNAAINTGAIETCDGVDNNCNTLIDEGVTITFYEDLDGDTFGNPLNSVQACTAPIGFVLDNTDCDDTDATINPNGTEVCDGSDNNCNTQIDEGVTITFYADNDGDGFGDPLNTTQACTAPAGFVSDNTDCDDTNPAVNTSAIEDCDGIDNDCDTQIDESGSILFYADTDGDSFGDPLNTTSACIAPIGFVADNTDCDDTNAGINPAASELCNGIDDNCNTLIDEGVTITFYADSDGDTFGDALNTIMACTAPVGYVANSTDCDDTNPAINPSAVEICDGIDNNCNTTIDEGGTITFYADIDGDTFGDPLNTTQSCTQPVGFVLDNTDCDDSNASINSNATEVCDGVDNDCDTQIDESGNIVFYADTDGDTFGDASNTILACTAPTGYVSNNTDCNDADATVFPGAPELCDGLDNNCNTFIDEGALLTFYFDNDGDAFGDAAITIQACIAPVGYVANNTDCNDSDAAINPAAVELCDGIDNNCNTLIDEGALITFYADNDGDTFGDPNNNIQACTAPIGFVTNNADCDDTNPAINPSAIEVCDGIDNNCNTLIDEGVTTTYYADLDGDTFGDPLNTIQACSLPLGYVTDNTDCDDTNAAINVNGTEVCDSVDNNCNTVIDEGVTTTYYADLDGDTFGNPLNTIQACSLPVGYVTDNTDCNDTNAAININGTEDCDGLDNDCDTFIDETGTTMFYADTDGDTFGDASNFIQGCIPPAGYVSNNTDCNDSNASINPAATEICDGIDNNCNTLIDDGALNTYYADTDNDTFGDPLNSVQACTPPTGFVTNNTDCDDTDPAINSNATEICDGVDNDCDTQIDEGVSNTYFADLDGDTFGDPLSTTLACVAPVGYVSDNTDCDDADASVYPSAIELCDGLDNDCDVEIDENTSLITFYEDLDGDGFGNLDVTIEACVAPTGFVANADDCDDFDFTVYPGAEELCDGIDNNCDDIIDEGLPSQIFYLDADFDGFGTPTVTIEACAAPFGFVDNDLDCNDGCSDCFPGAEELCDGFDNDCDDVIDNGFELSTFYLDDDGDGFGDLNNSVLACVAPPMYTDNSDDCDDSDSFTYPGADELCDGFDNDCDLVIDNGLDNVLFYADADGDSFGDPNVSILACVPPPGYVDDMSDCDDTDANVNLFAEEICDGIDNDCDTDIDEDIPLTTYYLDSDGDGYGDVNNTIENCALPLGYVENSEDCDDTDNAINPDATDICDSIDNDCDLDIDEDAVFITYYEDLDADGFGNASISLTACSQPSGFVDNSLDCDDNNEAINPSVADICDGIDNDCDLDIDEDAVFFNYYLDADNDGFGDIAEMLNTCEQPAGYVENALDCNDNDASLNPNQAEICDEIDNNCDGNINEGITCEIFVPEGISPNGDGINDVFVIDGASEEEVIELNIFNRWGALVYASNNYKNDWDGRSSEGAFTGDLPAGTYYYIIKVDGEEKVGYITLWR